MSLSGPAQPPVGTSGSRRAASGRAPRRPHADHRRRWLVWTVVAVVLAVGGVTGGPWVYARLVADAPPDPLALSTATATATASPGPSTVGDLQGEWRVAEGSQAGYRLGEVLTAQQVTVVGRTEQVSGTVTVTDGVLTAARVVVDTASISTDESARDAYFRRALDSTTYPEAVFELTGPVDVTGLLGAEDAVTVAAPGSLTFHGVTQAVTAELQVQLTAAGVEVAGQVPVTLADYGLDAPDLGFVTVEPTGAVELLLVLAR